jgi:hypothetical protein
MPCITKAKLPHYSERKGGWVGGSKKTLYTFTDNHTGRKVVRHAEGTVAYGPSGTVRLATRAEALRLWQNPLHSSWKTSCPVGLRRRRR